MRKLMLASVILLGFISVAAMHPGSTEPTRYIASLNQTDTNAPSAGVGENTLGSAITFSRDDVGAYYASGFSFPGSNRTFCFISNGLAHVGSASCQRASDGTILIVSIGAGTSSQSDDVLRDASIEILVYP